MADNDLFIEIAGGKKINRFLISPKKHEYIIGSGKNVDFQVGNRDLKDVHIKFVRNPNTNEWRAEDLSDDLFQIKGSLQKRSTAAVALKQAIAINSKCIMRINAGKASLSEKLLASKSVGGLGFKEYAVMILAPISIAATVFIVLQNQPAEIIAKERDAILKCHAQRTGPALTKYKYGSTYLERVWPDEYYDCVKNAEASCKAAYAMEGEKRSEFRNTYNDFCHFLSETRDEMDDGRVAIDYFTSKYPAQLSIDKFNAMRLANPDKSISLINDKDKAITQEVCFTCDDYDKLNAAQKQACDQAGQTVNRLKRARELWSSGRGTGALREYRDIKANTSQTCEAYRAADFKSRVILEATRPQGK